MTKVSTACTDDVTLVEAKTSSSANGTPWTSAAGLGPMQISQNSFIPLFTTVFIYHSLYQCVIPRRILGLIVYQKLPNF